MNLRFGLGLGFDVDTAGLVNIPDSSKTEFASAADILTSFSRIFPYNHLHLSSITLSALLLDDQLSGIPGNVGILTAVRP